jgi:outer membrane protein OmpA-like peptidoglycan-associated protein
VFEQKLDELSGPPVVTGALEPPATEDTNGPKTGAKRQVNESQNLVDGDEESTGKKQKIEQSSQTRNGTAPSTVTESNRVTFSNGEEKKKPDRPKKLKDIAKKLTPRSTEGIGSRTRSQTKST